MILQECRKTLLTPFLQLPNTYYPYHSTTPMHKDSPHPASPTTLLQQLIRIFTFTFFLQIPYKNAPQDASTTMNKDPPTTTI
ncbi:hypothetical protein GDO81_000293 [Engystomops pustulosus]|uniref:Uncharacterized protein n=1 Tax=Engystomops pustulosus TaxID=76066 RepID=A0AAV7D6A6_ENGPU|nr:hypothetical protein GDO81_000293 [Engystomops pustulosus]